MCPSFVAQSPGGNVEGEPARAVCLGLFPAAHFGFLLIPSAWWSPVRAKNMMSVLGTLQLGL